MKTIEIRNGRRKICKHRFCFENIGMKFEKRNYGKSFYSKKINEYEEKELIEYCKKHKLKYMIIENKYVRNNTYRKEFLAMNEGKKYLLCAYCGFPYKTEKITVDHIIPVDKVKNGKKVQDFS